MTARSEGGGPGALAALVRAVAFGAAAPVYSFLTAHDAWRASCRELGALVPGPLVLDLGVGPGASALEPNDGAERIHIGLDISGEMLRRAARTARVRGLHLPLVRADALRLPIRDGSLDGATAHSVLYLLPDPLAGLSEVRRALRRGGRAALLEPRAARPSAREAWAGGPRHLVSMLLWRGMSRIHTRFDEGELVALLTAAGLGRARAWPVLGGFGVMAVAERTD